MVTPPVIVEEVGGKPGDAYLVRPSMPPAGPAVVYLHWFDEAPNANRTQYLEEAKTLASAGVVSLLPQLTFPWHSPPMDIDTDLGRITKEIENLVSLHDLLIQVDGVDPESVAVAGHDFGAMYGTLLANRIEARAAVFVAPTPRWADWFLRFWPIESDRFDYMRALNDVDPIGAVAGAEMPKLFQFGRDDFYIAAMTSSELYQAAAEPKQLIAYDTGHAMDLDEIRSDRLTFLSESLEFTLETASDQ